MIRRVLRFVLSFLVACFFFVRQVYVNLLHIDRAAASALFVLIMSAVAVWFLVKRAKERAPGFYLIDIIIAIQLVIAGLATACYWLAGDINSPEAAYAIYYYAFAPLLLYVGFYLRTRKQEEIRRWQVVSYLVFVVMILVSVLQIVGIDWWVFRNEKWAFIQTFFGLPRPTAGYGTQIDFGALCFIFFVCAFYEFFETRSLRSAFIAFLGFAGTVLTFSRIFIFASVAVIAIQFLRPSVLRSLKRKGVTLAAVALSAALVTSVFQQLNVIAIFKAEDAITQDSNEGRLLYLKSSPKWLLEDYPYVGTGPGTQNGPNDETKTITDFLWLALLVEFGSMVGLIVLVLKFSLPLIVIYNYLRSSYRPAYANAAFVLSISFLLISFIDSAFAHMVSISVFYLIIGTVLYGYYGGTTSDTCLRTVAT